MAKSSPIRVLPLALLGMLGASPAFSQTEAQPAGPGKSAMPAAANAVAAPAVARAHPVVERRIADLHERLKITSAEQPAFDAFAAVMRSNAGRMDGLLQARRKGVATLTALDQMKSYQELAQAHADDMQRLVPAFEHLYDGLSPEQKKLADTSFRNFAQTGGRGRT